MKTKSPAAGTTVVNGIVLERLSIDLLANMAQLIWEDGKEAKDEGNEKYAALAWTKYQTVVAHLERRLAA